MPRKRLQQALEAVRMAEEKARREAAEKAKRDSIPPPGHLRRAADCILVRLDKDQEMEFVCIPEGEFLMGSDSKKDKSSRSDQQPQHFVNLTEYWIGRAPVTNAQYAAFLLAAGVRAPSHWQNSRPPGDRLDHPVVCIGWRDAAAYCEWLSWLTGRQISLPTEAQWEKAARGTDGRTFPWGNQTPDAQLCNFDRTIGDTTPVGRYSPQGDGPYGCVDMAGNVWEWCADWFDENYYAKSPPVNPPGSPSGRYRVMRGGSWTSDVGYVRVPHRGQYLPEDNYNTQGFRCLLSLNILNAAR